MVRLLTIQHQADCPPGLLETWLRSSGVHLDVVHPYLGMPLPASLSGYSGLLVLGGSMSAYDDEAAPWLPRVKELMRTAVSESLPTLGTCLGHQLLAVACGGRVEPSPAGRKFGMVLLGTTADILLDPLWGAIDTSLLFAIRSNRDIVVELPPDSVVLADSDAPPSRVGQPNTTAATQAFRVGEAAWGVQFHPEATPQIAQKWAEHHKAAVYVEFGEHADTHPEGSLRLRRISKGLGDVKTLQPMSSEIWQGLATRFADQVLAHAYR